jgi:regulatory protein
MQIHYELEKQIQLLIYVDGELWKTGDVAILGKRPDLPKQCDSLDQLEDWYSSLEYKGGKNYAYRRLASKSFCSSELSTLLAKKQVSEPTRQKIIQELVQKGYLNDEEWAEAFIKYQSHKKNGPKAIRQKLKAKGYDNPGPLLQTLCPPETQKEAILKLISTRYRSRDFSDKYERAKVIAALMRKGYDLDVILQSFSLS